MLLLLDTHHARSVDHRGCDFAMKTRVHGIFALACALVFFAAASYGETSRTRLRYEQGIHQLDYGYIDYGNRKVVAVGFGYPSPYASSLPEARASGKRNALTIAKKNLLDCMLQVEITPQKNLRDLTTRSPLISKKIQEIVSTAEVIDVSFMSDGSIEVTVSASITNDLLESLGKVQ